MKVSPFQSGRLLKLHLLLTIPSPESRPGSDFTFPPSREGRQPPAVPQVPALPASPTSPGRAPANSAQLRQREQPSPECSIPTNSCGRALGPAAIAPPTAPQLLPAGCSAGTGSAPSPPPGAAPGHGGLSPEPGLGPLGGCGRWFWLLLLCKSQIKQETARAPPLRPRSPSGGRHGGGSGTRENRE